MNFSGNGYLKADLARRSPPFGKPVISAPTSPGLSPEKRIIAVSAVTALLCLCLIAVLVGRRLSLPDVSDKQTAPRAQADKVSAIRVDSTSDLLENLRSRNLWDIADKSVVPPVLFANLPQDMNDLEVVTKKKAFINTLLPISLIAIHEVAQEKKSLQAILDKLGSADDILFFDDEAIWPQSVSDEEIDLLQHLAQKYRTNSKEKLLLRVDVLPVSLILAQGALESSWGSSRFAAEGNNLFGIWTWGTKGMIPANREEGAMHKVASYDTLLDSVRAYLLMINRLPAYTSLRELRSRTASSMDIAAGLRFYSERRDSYIQDVKQIIVTNELQRFDSMELAENLQWQPPREKPVNLVSLDRSRNANI
ncbi:MAG: glucosaminidase domain-containing protein [Proteobacteria bacterium]|nr:glucosaminidase domain-containing protein [Pseudomonadota bacterium]MBU4295610.1 glucosaminidase domain-containing protein [Pseudomonadota bacterium]MCG2746801.1 glucosaminidase domain-containing protein [Desulfobulbaceae bacterium]